jgi:hypothetical protein
MKKPVMLWMACCSLALGGAAVAQTATDLTCTSCVGETDLANQAVSSAKIANGTITSTDIKLSTITSDRIRNGTLVRADLSPSLQDSLDGAIANITTAKVTASGAGVAGADCPSSRIPVAASCECDDSNGSRNLGVLFTCAVSGTGAVAACFDEALTFNPQLPAPLAIVRAVCLGAETVDGTPWVPAAVGLVPGARLEASPAAAAEQARWMSEQHATFQQALDKLKGQRARHEARREVPSS